MLETPYKINAELLPKHYADKLIEWRYQHPQVLRNFVDEKKTVIVRLQNPSRRTAQ